MPNAMADNVHDALLGVVHRVERHAELGAVPAQRLDLRARHRVRDRREDVQRGDVVVFGRDGEVRPADGAAREAEPVERLRTGDLVHEVEIDVEQVRFLPLTLTDQVLIPHLLGQRDSHGRLLDISEFGKLVLLRGTV
jgi:hypothetical protein